MLEVGPDRPFSTSPTDALLSATEDESIEVFRDCWDCGWHEERQIRVESIETTEGDEVAVKRANLIAEITDELAAIESPATLEDTLAEVRQHRRVETSSDETGGGTME
jgi:23S rRNA maturation-related 3'-5' exoribonuclease YhaM|nr:hypothetical protein [Natronomonas aquatica]